MNFKPRITQLAKAPIAGKVKTRLISALGEQGACELHMRMVKSLYERFSPCFEFQYELWVSEQHEFFESLGELMPRVQKIGDLGEKLSHIVQQAKQGQITILIGSDCVEIESDSISAMVEELNWADIVFIPALDGGYVALGMKQSYPELFEDITWGSDKVLKQSLEKAESLGLVVSVLPPMRDVDRPEDLEALQSSFPEFL